jgi:PAS domain S-box-containing protein
VTVPRFSLRAKLAIGFAGPMAVICLFIFAYFPARLERQSMAAVRAKAVSIAAMTAYSVAPALYFGDVTGLDEAVEPALRNPDLSYVEVRDSTGAAIERWHGPAGRAAEGRFDLEQPIRFRDATIGVLGLGLSLADVRAEVARSRAGAALLSALLFLIGFGVVVALSALFVRPIHRIAGTAQRIAAGDLDLRVGHHGRDEVGALAVAFDAMVERLAAAHEALRAVNRGLEDRVATRTAELEREIEGRERVEQALRASESRLRAIFDSAALGIALLDERGRLVHGNPAVGRMLGRSEPEWLERPLADFVEPADLPRAVPLLPPLAVETEQPVEAEFRLRRPDGAPMWTRAAASVVAAAPAGEPRVIVLLSDITRQRDLEARVRDAQKMEAVGRLAGGVAHDFNNLLTTINGVAELLLAELPPDSREAQDAREIRRAGDIAARLTRQLLAFGRKQVLRQRDVDVNAAVGSALAQLQPEFGDHIVVRTVLGDGLPRVHADPALLQEVLTTLALNSRDAMPGGGRLTVRTDLVDISRAEAAEVGLAAPGPHVALEVEDTGTGMDARMIERIFEPFFTTKAAEAREVGRGAGLGLASVYGIVKQSSGAITVRSEPGRGSLFRVLLPAPVLSAALERPATDPGAAGRGRRVLVVEDDDAVRRLVTRILGRGGYQVVEARTAADALEQTQRARPDLLLTDVVMPGGDGTELAGRLRDRWPTLPVIFMSGYPADAQGVPAGDRTRFLAKPMPAAELLAQVDALLAPE